MEPDFKLACATAPKRNSNHWLNTWITWGDLLGWMATPADHKECGDYILGTLRETTKNHDGTECFNLHRSKRAIVDRSAITLDLDSPTEHFLDTADLLLPWAAVLHTTFKSTPDAPRYRLIIPVAEPMAPDEYIAAAKAVMSLLGDENFDAGSSEPERYMFKPSAAKKANWFWRTYDGPLATSEALLEHWDPDLSDRPMPNLPNRKRDPFDLPGVSGAFNRAYEDIQVLIEEYQLPYSPAGDNRWHLVGAASMAGMGLAAPGVIYSHHANDPAYGQACTAFDLVRLHRFGDLDEKMRPGTEITRLPSYQAMMELASVDARVIGELVGLDFDKDMDDDPEAWKLGLRHNRNGTELMDTVGNYDLIRDNDPLLQNIRFNSMTLATESTEDFPWRKLGSNPALSQADRASFQMYMERTYKIRPARSVSDWMIDERAHSHAYNPVKEWLTSLSWDGIPRMEECLPGVTPTEYTRMVARKSLVAAVARMFEPGCKWDHTLILHGKEGLGKTYWIETMSRGWTAPLQAIGHKDTLINLQRCWIATSDEGSSMRKAEADVLKEFLTRRTDVFRLPYEREASSHPRHSVIWGTTNDDIFLRRQEGNRRFLIVRVEKHVDRETLTDHYVEQVWAEAVYAYRMGEVLLWLDEHESQMAAAERFAFEEEGDSTLEGIIAHYTDLKFPADWFQKSVMGRVNWLRDREDGLEPEGVQRFDEICALQILIEAMGKQQAHIRRQDVLEVGRALVNLGWEKMPGRKRMLPYGPQTVYRRSEDALGDRIL